MARRPGRQIRDILNSAKELDIVLPEADDLEALVLAFRSSVAERLRHIRINRRVNYAGKLWIVKSIRPIVSGRNGVVYVLREVYGSERLEVCDTVFLKGLK